MKKITTTPFLPSDVQVESIGKNRAKISAYPFENGYAITLAHPLRRLLLSSSVGYAPIALKVEGASHEFDSIRGMVEDIAIFIINLKNIRFKIIGEDERVEISYSFNGSKEIKGGDLSNDIVEIVTPELALATINSDVELRFTLILQKGIGYVPSEEISDEFEDGFIKLDAFFSPVKKAVYSIENMLVEDDPNFEKIVFDITTDGQVDPIDAFEEAISVMYKQLAVFNKVFDVNMEAVVEESEEENDDLKEFLVSISDFSLGARSYNALEKANIKYFGELVLMNEDEIKNIKNLGKKSFDEIANKLDELGYPISSELDEKIASALSKQIEALKA